MRWWWIHISLSRMADDKRKYYEVKKRHLQLIERAGGGLPLSIAGWILCLEPLFSIAAAVVE
jgi:hypothetical protein